MPITITPAGSQTPVAIQPRLRLSLDAIGKLKAAAKLPARRPRFPYARFVIQTSGPADLTKVTRVIYQVLGGAGNGPTVTLSGGHFQPPQGTMPNLSDVFDVRPLFKGADPRERQFKLADFVVLTLPISPLELKKRLGGGGKSLFDFAYELKARGNFLRVDPEIPNKKWRINTQVVVVPNPTPGVPGGTPGVPPDLVTISSRNILDSAPVDHAWNLRAINLNIQNNGGKGITIGQVDSGTRTHPESDGIYVSDTRHFSVIDGSNIATDPLDGTNPAHGLATASVLASRGSFTAVPVSGMGTTGPTSTPGRNQEVTGVANQCTILPVRAVSSVVSISNIDVAEGIWHCVSEKVAVITISVGGYLNMWLERVVSFAVFSDIIVVAAAGQYWPFVPAPACYPDCIAATASDSNDRHWFWASSGPQIDIAAPGAGVYCADVKNNMNVVNPASGTSFSAPTVAGAAALWLRAHGRQTLIDNYQGQRKLQEVFRHLIRATARVPGSGADQWNTTDHGPGIINVGTLLAAALPAANAVAGRNWLQYDDTSEFQILRDNLGMPNENYLLTVLALWFNTNVNNVKTLLEEFGTEILTIAADVPTIADNLKDAVQQQANNAQEAVEEAIDEATDAVVDVASNVASTVMGWFS